MHVWGTVAGARAGTGRAESGRAAKRPGRTPPRFSSPAETRGGRSVRAADTAESDRAVERPRIRLVSVRHAERAIREEERRTSGLTLRVPRYEGAKRLTRRSRVGRARQRRGMGASRGGN